MRALSRAISRLPPRRPVHFRSLPRALPLDTSYRPPSRALTRPVSRAAPSSPSQGVPAKPPHANGWLPHSRVGATLSLSGCATAAAAIALHAQSYDSRCAAATALRRSEIAAARCCAVDRRAAAIKPVGRAGGHGGAGGAAGAAGDVGDVRARL